MSAMPALSFKNGNIVEFIPAAYIHNESVPLESVLNHFASNAELGKPRSTIMVI